MEIPKKREGVYKFTKEMLNVRLNIPQHITHINYRNEKGIVEVYVTGEDVPEVLEGGEPVIMRQYE